MFPDNPLIVSTIKNPFQLFEKLGSVWRDLLSDADLLRYHQWAKLQLTGDVYLRAVAMAAAQSIQTVEPFVARQWRLIRLLESELHNDSNKVRYGSGKTFGDGTVFGQVASHSFIWPVASDIAEIGLLVDHVIEPAHVFDISNCIFDPTLRQLSFAANPFDLLEALPVYDDAGTLVDRQVLLWARNVQEDHRTPYLRFGSVLGIKSDSSADYTAVLRACWAMLVKGPSIEDLKRGILASVGLPYTVGSETVEIVQTDDEGLAVVTDQNVYRFHADATPLVEAGDLLVEGQALVDTVQVIEFASGTTPDYSLLPGLAAGPELANVASTLVFPNVDETFTFTDNAGVVEARFSVFGHAADVEAFWAAVHTAGIASGRTLANWLGVSGTGVTLAVNPLKWMLQNVLLGNVLAIVLKPQHFRAFETGFIRRIRSLIPAGTLLVTQIALEPASDVLDLSELDETVTLYDAIVPPTDVATVDGDGLIFSDYAPAITVT